MTLGMRNIKTALAVFIALTLSYLLKSEYPFFAAIAAVISMETTVANSVTVGINRLKGTLLGAGAGLVMVLFHTESTIITSLGVIAVIYACSTMKWNSSVPIATIVYLSIVISHGTENPLLYSANRIFDTFLGIAVALTVNYLVFPFDNSQQLMQLSLTLRDHVASLNNDWESHRFHSFSAALKEMEAQYGLLQTQYRNKMRYQSLYERIGQELALFSRVDNHLNSILQIKDYINTRPAMFQEDVLRNAEFFHNTSIAALIDEINRVSLNPSSKEAPK